MRGDARTRGEGGRRAGLVEGGVISSFGSSFVFSSVVVVVVAVFEDCVLGERPRRDRVVGGGGEDVGDFVTGMERIWVLFYWKA